MHLVKKKILENALANVCTVAEEYNGILDASTITKKYPYLESFFEYLDTWRMQQDRATIDDKIIDEAAAKTKTSKEY